VQQAYPAHQLLCAVSTGAPVLLVGDCSACSAVLLISPSPHVHCLAHITQAAAKAMSPPGTPTCPLSKSTEPHATIHTSLTICKPLSSSPQPPLQHTAAARTDSRSTAHTKPAHHEYVPDSLRALVVVIPARPELLEDMQPLHRLCARCNAHQVAVQHTGHTIVELVIWCSTLLYAVLQDVQ
jgi:hypothetical protein